MSSHSKKFNGIPLSVLDLAGINEGSDAGTSIKNSVKMAQHVEKLGFNRYWLAEHHNMPGIASSATSVLIGHIANATERMRVGSGGVMLPNHAPLVIAEQFGTLEAMYPGRIDLGLGRAPGSDQATAYALRRTLNSSGNDFPEQVDELRSYFKINPTARVRAIPGEGADIPIWLLGSSGFSAELSSKLGLPFSFASHFAPDYVMEALQIYHQNFTPSKDLKEPYTMLGINVIAAETDEKADFLATSLKQQFLNMGKGISKKFQPPVKDIDASWSPQERNAVGQALGSKATIIGGPETVKRKLNSFLEETKTNEFIISSPIFDHEERLKSFDILGEMME